MSDKLLTTMILSLSLFIGGCGREAENRLKGKFLLFEHPEGVDTPDAIEFSSNGACLRDVGDNRHIAAKYQIDREGRLVIVADTSTTTTYTYQYQLLNHTLKLAGDDLTLFYVRPPESQHPRFEEIVGTFGMHSDLGESAGQITSDHKFREHLHNFVPDDHAYYDIHMDGTCSYGDGVVTYLPEHSNAPQKDKYLRDFIIKRDASGLWIIDPFHDSIVCQTPATNLDLSPPPEGYQKEQGP